MFLAVTTFHEKGRAEYGQRMMTTFHQFWPEEVGLRVYAEGWRASIPEATVTDLEQASDWLGNFKARHAWRDAGNGYRMDAVRFSHKIAALLAANERMNSRYLVWMDGDIVTHSPVTLEVLNRWAPKDGQWISWLERRKVYPECGFYIIDRDHPRHREMLQALRKMYDGDELFTLPEWHDSYVLWEVVKRSGVGTKNLSGTIGTRTHHPFVNSELGSYMDHLKGKRKQRGKSMRTDLVFPRREGYWKR